MTIKPKAVADLTLAPVAAEIDLNLQSLRDGAPDEVAENVALTLNREPGTTRSARAEQVLEVATRGVDLHGWTASISDDATRVQLRGGSVRLDVGLSAAVREYIG